MSRDRQLDNLRFWADHAIGAARLERDRLVAGTGEPRYDLDFYVLAVWRLGEIARRAGDLGIADSKVVATDMKTRLPHLDEVRNWWLHAKPDMVNHSYFSDGIMRWTQPATFVVDIGDHDDVVERFYERLTDALGPPSE